MASTVSRSKEYFLFLAVMESCRIGMIYPGWTSSNVVGIICPPTPSVFLYGPEMDFNFST